MKKAMLLVICFWVMGVLADEQETRCLPWSIGGKPCSMKVDVSGQVCAQEQTYVAARSPLVDDTLQEFLGRGYQGRIASCFSGGGYRAMVSALGFEMGLQEIGLSGGVTYRATLSGSSWFATNWLLRKQVHGVTLSEFRDLLEARIKKPLLHAGSYDFGALLDKMVSVLTERGRIETADLLGAVGSNRLFNDFANFQDLTFAPLRDAFMDGSFNEPFTLCSLVLADVFPYEWLEVNPYVVRSDFLGASIPTSMFDSYFKKGECHEVFTERSLGWFLVLFGSAYNFSIGDILLFIAKESGQGWFLDMVEKFVDQHDLHEVRMFSSPVYNFTYQMPGLPLEEERETEVSDAGMDFNLPLPLLFTKGRDVDVIFVCDASIDVAVDKHVEMHYAKAYMDRKGIPFPSLENPRKVADNVLIFEDAHDTTIPAIVYFANPVPEGTLEFAYTKEEFDAVYETIRASVLASKQAIKELLTRRAEGLA